MTDIQQNQPPTAPVDHRAAKAEAKAAKAYAKATRPWFKKKRFLAPLAVVAVIVIVVMSNRGGSDTANTSTSSDSSAVSGSDQPAAGDDAAESMPGIGDKVRDGKFAFTVTKVRSGVARVGSDVLGQKAQGQFVMVTVKVKNIGDESQTLFGDNQTLFIGGKKYAADTEAAIYMDDSKTFIEDINPGNSLTGVLVFDVPKNATTFDKIELHDSAFSGGVEVALTK